MTMAMAALGRVSRAPFNDGPRPARERAHLATCVTRPLDATQVGVELISTHLTITEVAMYTQIFAEWADLAAYRAAARS